jgi:hypothetical protein
MRPVTVRAAHNDENVTALQRIALDQFVTYLANTLEPDSPLLPDTGRIVIEWGDEEELAQLRESMA